jgi:hypothetical protein
MNVQFESPKTALDSNGNKIWKDGFDPKNPLDFDLIPDKPGVYIYGIKLECEESEYLKDKFLPLYVGIAKDLRIRLKNEHYNGLKINGNGKKEIFDLTDINCNIKNIKDLYNQMKIYDSVRGIHLKRFALARLIWFNNFSFFDYKLNLPNSTSTYVVDSGHQFSIKPKGDLDNIQIKDPKSNALLLKNKIVDTKSIFTNQFYFFYVKLTDVKSTILSNHELYDKNNGYLWRNNNARGEGMNVCERVELTTKGALEKQYKIYTTAEAKGKTSDMNIDFSKVKNELINLI